MMVYNEKTHKAICITKALPFCSLTSFTHIMRGHHPKNIFLWMVSRLTARVYLWQLERRGLLKRSYDHQKKYYKITPKGWLYANSFDIMNSELLALVFARGVSEFYATVIPAKLATTLGVLIEYTGNYKNCCSLLRAASCKETFLEKRKAIGVGKTQLALIKNGAKLTVDGIKGKHTEYWEKELNKSAS